MDKQFEIGELNLDRDSLNNEIIRLNNIIYMLKSQDYIGLIEIELGLKNELSTELVSELCGISRVKASKVLKKIGYKCRIIKKDSKNTKIYVRDT